MVKAIKEIMANPKTMEKYNASAVHKAVLLAMYDFLKAGHKLSDLPWFRRAH